jgi:hypothetical protein
MILLVNVWANQKEVVMVNFKEGWWWVERAGMPKRLMYVKKSGLEGCFNAGYFLQDQFELADVVSGPNLARMLSSQGGAL